MSEQLNNPATDNDEISLKELVLKIKEWHAYLKTKFLLIVLMG